MISKFLLKIKTWTGLVTLVVFFLAACAPAGRSTSVPAEPIEELRDYSDFSVAQTVVQESIDVLNSSDIGSGSQGLAKLKSALNESGPTEAWCDAVQTGVDALVFARSNKQADILKSVANAQGC